MEIFIYSYVFVMTRMFEMYQEVETRADGVRQIMAFEVERKLFGCTESYQKIL